LNAGEGQAERANTKVTCDVCVSQKSDLLNALHRAVYVQHTQVSLQDNEEEEEEVKGHCLQ